MKLGNLSNKPAFTIVELLVVIVVIGILAAITIVSYTGISQKAVASSLQSDLTQASKQLEMFYIDNSVYPNVINDCPTPTSTNLCLKPSGSNQFTDYSPNNTTNPP
ncbi:MAG: prepilin-type N-terminal cleavage/methylation domain-containing protein, partial [Candidatus Saccharibacteria bacterium]